MIFHHRWYLCLLHWMIHSLIQLRCNQFFNSHPSLHITQLMSCKLLQYLVWLHLILQITCHCCPPIMEVAIFMDAWLMCLSWPQPNNNGSHNIYGCMVDVSKLTSAQLQQHYVMLLQHYHGLCDTNDPSSMFASPPPIPNIESLSQSTISSLDSGSFRGNQADVNIQQPNT